MGEDVTVDDAIDYIADNIENLCDIIESNVGITDELCAAISLPEDQDGIKAPDFPSGCDDIERIETRTILDKTLWWILGLILHISWLVIIRRQILPP